MKLLRGSQDLLARSMLSDGAASERADGPLGANFREHPRPKTVNTSWWSCRESNPGPLTQNHVFYERSPLDAFLSLGT
jgi:hypothetical protein